MDLQSQSCPELLKASNWDFREIVCAKKLRAGFCPGIFLGPVRNSGGEGGPPLNLETRSGSLGVPFKRSGSQASAIHGANRQELLFYLPHPTVTWP